MHLFNLLNRWGWSELPMIFVSRDERPEFMREFNRQIFVSGHNVNHPGIPLRGHKWHTWANFLVDGGDMVQDPQHPYIESHLATRWADTNVTFMAGPGFTCLFERDYRFRSVHFIRNDFTVFEGWL